MTWLQRIFMAIIKFPARFLIKTNVIPTDLESELGIDRSKPIIYLLKTQSVTDLIALQKAMEGLNLPDPVGAIPIQGQEHHTTLYLEQPQSVISRKVQTTTICDQFTQIFKLQRQDPKMDLQIVPVSMFWGRAPGKSNPGWSDILADRASPSWLRKLFIVLLLGRDNFVCFSPAVSSRQMAELHGSDKQISHKLIRVARTHFYRRNQNMTGPSLLEKQQLYNAILASSSVKQAIKDEKSSKKRHGDKARENAEKYIKEIAADYKEGFIRIGDRLLTRVWNKIYNGIQVKNADKVRELAQNGHEIIYVPCHRSHMDYLLLTYAIYHEGLVTPHIAAGINLNFWPAGPLFRRAGAFFIRRSFAGNKLYTAVFREYLEQLFNRGYSVKYYPEGGRSRTGRLLPPKTGMLAMTVQAMLKGINRPVSLVPVYIGYEHVMEVNSYLNELKGRDKKKESFGQVFSAIRQLKNYGHGYLSFGDPIQLSSFLDQQVPDWQQTDYQPEKKPSWLTPAVNSLANEVMCRINQSAVTNGMALCSLSLLAAENHALSEQELTSSLKHFVQLQKQAPFSSNCCHPEQSAEEMLAQTLSLNKLTISQDQFGRMISLEDSAAVAHTYYRNNILHMFAIPGLIAATVIAHNGLEKTQILAIVQHIYPLLSKELFIYMSPEKAQDYAENLIRVMKETGLLKQKGRKVGAPDRDSSEYISLLLLNNTIQQTLQRYTLVLTLLENQGNVSRSGLEKQSREAARRLSSLHGISAPEFSDKNVFSTFVSALKENQLLEDSEEGLLMHSQKSSELQHMLVQLLSPEVAHTIGKIG